MTKEEKFLNYLTSLRNESNTQLLECIVKGYVELLEYNETGSASPNMSNDPTYMDNQMNINPNSTGFQDNILTEDLENVDGDPDEINSQGNPEESYTDSVLGLEEGIGGAVVKGAIAAAPLIKQGVKSLASNPAVRSAAKAAATGVATAGINRVGQSVQQKIQQPQQQQPQQNVALSPQEIQLIKQFRMRQQGRMESILNEFAPPADVQVGTGGPLVSDKNPFESGGASEHEKDENAELKELYKLLAHALERVEKLMNIQSEEEVDAEFIMEDKSEKN